MKIFIIGPEGSGKTVLLAMLSRYVATEREDLVFEPVDHESKQYVINALGTLEKEDWPPSTTQATLPTLQWRFGSRDKPRHEIVLFDAAGQDLREILKQDSSTELSHERRAIKERIDAANVLIYLIDLNGFLGTNDLIVRDENAWLFKTFLSRPEWRDKRRLVVLSKADLYADMLATLAPEMSEDSKVRDLVKRHLPKNYTLDHLVDGDKEVTFFAVASVATKTVFDQDDNPVRLPKKPLNPSGIKNLVDTLVREAARLSARQIQKEKIKAEEKRQKQIIFLVAVLLVLIGFACWLSEPNSPLRSGTCRNCNESGYVSCQHCSGKGSVTQWTEKPVTCPRCNGTGETGRMWKDPCNACNKTGKAMSRTSAQVRCNECGGSGKLTCTKCQGTKKIQKW